MEDISSIKVCIQNNYPNITMIGTGDCILITNDAENSKTYKKLKDKLKAMEINNYLTEFSFKICNIFIDMSKFAKFVEYNELLTQFLEQYPSSKDLSKIKIIEWLWEHDDKTEILIDIEINDDGYLSGVIFKDKKIMYTVYLNDNEDDDLCPQNNIDKDLIKRTEAFKHIKFSECADGYYYDKGEDTHDYCLEILERLRSNTVYYEKKIGFLNTTACKNYSKKEAKDLLESFERNEELLVTWYDEKNEIYKEINYGFLIKEINGLPCCYKKVVNNQEIEISEMDKTLCEKLGITYQRF